MGVLHGRDLFSSKWPTAIIKDSSKRLHFVPIKHTIGDYFITVIDNKWYVFKLDEEVCEYRQSLTKSFKVYIYDTKHFRPLKSEIKELELALKQNGLGKVNVQMANIFKLLGNRERDPKDFDGHDINEIIKHITNYDKSKLSRIIPKDQSIYKRQFEIIVNYLDHLGVDRIVTPLKGISNFIEDDLRGRDPGFLGTIANQLESLNYESKKVNNEPIGSKKAWLLPLAIIVIISLIIVVVYMAYENGAFDGITSMFPDLSGVSFSPPPVIPTPDSAVAKYKSPEAAKAAIDRGEAKLTDFPPEMRGLISSVKTPTVSP